MGTWEDRFRRREPREPCLELVEHAWRMLSPTQRILDCGIYRTDVGLEVRCGYGEAGLMRSELVRDVATGRKLAEAWRQTALDMGRFEELSNTTH